MFENARPLALLLVYKGGPQSRSHKPQVEDFDLKDVDVVFTFKTEDGVEIPIEEFPEEVQEAARTHQAAVREAERKARIGRDSFASLSITTSPVSFPVINTISVHAISPEGDEEQTSSYRLFISFLVGNDEYKTPHDAGNNHHYLLCEVVVGVELALKLVQILMERRVQERLQIDQWNVSQRRGTLARENGCDLDSLRRKKAELLREHGLDDSSIALRRKELFREHNLTAEQNETAMEVIYSCHGLDDDHVAGRRARVKELLGLQATTMASGAPDPIKTLIEGALRIREEDTKPQG